MSARRDRDRYASLVGVGRVTPRAPPLTRTVAASTCQKETPRRDPLATRRAQQRTPRQSCDRVPAPPSAPIYFASRAGVAGFAAARPSRADRATTAPVPRVDP